MNEKAGTTHWKKWLVVLATLVLCIGIGTQAMAAAPYVPVYTTSNNITITQADGSATGGANDITFTWDGTLKTSVAVSGQVSNATIASPCTSTTPTVWKAHDVAVYGPGTYTVKASCAAKAPGCASGTNPITFTVAADEIGVHALLDWGVVPVPIANKNVDVVNVWKMNSVFGPSTLFTGGCGSNAAGTVWGLTSKDDGTGVSGYPMVDGPNIGARANFNMMGALINRVVDTTGNNFTMDQPDAVAFGGTNDIRFTWDGTKRTSVAVSGQVGNATVSSSCLFFGQPWWSHDMVIYGPGTYTVYTACPAGSPGCGDDSTGHYTFTVNAGEIGAHMLFLWNNNDNIDVVDVWRQGSFDQGVNPATCIPTDPALPTPVEFWAGACGTGDAAQVWDWMSYDWDGDCVNGAGMADGPFVGMNANFNVMGIPTCVCPDDGNPCTDDVCVAEVCTHPNNTAACNDGDACTSGDVCSAGTCAGTTITCDDGNVCTTDTCNTSTGCVYTNNTLACNDANACTSGDVCSAGTCAGTTITCDDGNVCTTDTCNTSTGCVYTNNTLACNDANACTSGDVCSAGICAGTTISCDDGNVCTTDTCNTSTGCVYTNNTLACNDASACTSGDVCSAGTCAGTTISCDDSNVCTTDTCNTSTGCVYTNNTATCDDGNVCTDGDVCAGGVCAGNSILNCCAAQPDGTPCSDGNACTLSDACAGGVCAGGGPLICDDSNVCTTDTCNTSTGCVYTNNTLACNDANACTSGDVCSAGVCAGTTIICDDSNVCTTDTCNTSTGCVYTNNTLACNDANACTSGDVCSAGTCAGTTISCDDGNVCTTDTCNTSTGCVYTNNTLACNDANACTSGDVCSAGICAGTTISCDDGNVCTTDTCNTATGCVNTAIVCNDSNACTDDTCNTSTGCVFTNNTAACNDSNACTSGDVCAAGVCNGTAIVCNDNNLCTSDTCNASTGCVFTANNITDNDACTTDECDPATGTVTHPTVTCNDNNACTTDTCNTTSGCVYAPVATDDNNACTADSCNTTTGVITHTAIACSDGDLDGNGEVTVTDALNVLRISAGITSPTASDFTHGDVAPLVNGTPDPDGNIDIGDVVVVLRRAIGLITW